MIARVLRGFNITGPLYAKPQEGKAEKPSARYPIPELLAKCLKKPELVFEDQLRNFIHSGDFYYYIDDGLVDKFETILKPYLIVNNIDNEYLYTSGRYLLDDLEEFCRRAQKAILIFAKYAVSNEKHYKESFLKAVEKVYHRVLSNELFFGFVNPKLEFTALTGKTFNPLYYQTPSQFRRNYHPLRDFDLEADSLFIPASIMDLDEKSQRILNKFLGASNPFRMRIVCIDFDDDRLDWLGLANGSFSIMNESAIYDSAYELLDKPAPYTDHCEGIAVHELGHNLLSGKGFEPELDEYIEVKGEKISKIKIHEFIAWALTIARQEQLALDILYVHSGEEYQYAADFLKAKLKRFLEKNGISRRQYQFIQNGYRPASLALRLKKVLGKKSYKKMVSYLQKAFFKRSQKLMRQIFKN